MFQTGQAPPLAQFVEHQLSSLIKLSDLPNGVADRLHQVFQLLTIESLNQPAEGPFPGLSRINADGLPFQWVLRTGAAGTGFGFLCEVGTPGDSPRERYVLSLERLRSACEVCGHANEWLDVIASTLIPQSEGDWPAHWRSALWIGVSPSTKGVSLKPYFNLNTGSARDRWLRAGKVLQALGRLRSLASLCDLSGHVSQESWPVGLTVDVLASGAPGRVKIYFYSGSVGPDWLQRWYEAASCMEHMALARRLLDLFPLTQHRRYPKRAFTVGLEFHPATEDVSLKTDLAVTKWMASDAEIARATMAMAHELGNARRLDSYLGAAGALPINHDSVRSFRFVGLGHEPDASSHLNIYLAPLPHRAVAPSRRTATRSIADAMCTGVAFLLEAQQGDHWSDFELPVGTSNGWVTAYTLARLGPVAPRSEQTVAALSRALDWLERVRLPGGGWSYNQDVEDDADSTAWAIMALRRHGRAVPKEAERFLESCRKPSGWFATYPANGPRLWHHAAPDVTAAAMCGLGEPWTAAAEARFRQIQCADGTIPAYWWTSPFYTAALLAEAYPQFSTSLLPDYMIEKWEAGLAATDFDLALLLLVHCGLGNLHCAGFIAEILRSGQRSDGSWTPSAILRLPPREMDAPWRSIDGGPVFRDIRGVFTTATVLGALAAFAKSLHGVPA